MRARIALFVAIIQAILFLGHWFVYETLCSFVPTSAPGATNALRLALAILSVSFVAASLLSFRYNNFFVRAFYSAAAVWIGFLNFFFLAAVGCWIAFPLAQLLRLGISRAEIAETLFGLAALAALYGIVNASWTRVERITVKLPGLPDSWRGRVAALVTDTHLGHVRGRLFMSRIVALIRRLHPDVVFIAGDLFDGTKADLARLAGPWKNISPRFGTYFVTGNHEEFSDSRKYLEAVELAGIRVLHNEKVEVDGLQIVGTMNGASGSASLYRSALENVRLDPSRATVLLTHVPHALSIAEAEGVSLQLSGHTHVGQMIPFTWFTWRIFGPFTYGLRRFGKMQVYTSSGAGTWGPPMRVGTKPEIALITFQ